MSPESPIKESRWCPLPPRTPFTGRRPRRVDGVTLWPGQIGEVLRLPTIDELLEKHARLNGKKKFRAREDDSGIEPGPSKRQRRVTRSSTRIASKRTSVNPVRCENKEGVDGGENAANQTQPLVVDPGSMGSGTTSPPGIGNQPPLKTFAFGDPSTVERIQRVRALLRQNEEVVSRLAALSCELDDTPDIDFLEALAMEISRRKDEARQQL